MGAIQSIFGKIKQVINLSKWKEVGSYRSTFSSFGQDIYKSEIVRSCIRPLSEHSSKANPRCKNNSRIEKILQYRPNMYMNGKDFIAKTRIQLEIKNTAFIYIQRDLDGRVTGFYPVPYSYFEAVEYRGMLYIKFHFASGSVIYCSWEEVAVIRKDYYSSDIAGDDNNAILDMLDMIHTTNQGIANAVKATANLRGILKSTKAMLSPTDIKKQKDDFVKDYLNLENEGGIASLDATQEFTPITMNPTITNYTQMKEFRENVYRYFGINDSIVTSDYEESQMEAFYEARIEPFLVALGLELTNKVFTSRERGHGAEIIFESNRMQYASNSTKLAMVALVDRGALTPNEWRMIFNLSPVDGGDKPIRRLDTAQVSEESKKQEDNKKEEKENGPNE